jgi:type IV pilus assembly protein PilY1
MSSTISKPTGIARHVRRLAAVGAAAAGLIGAGAGFAQTINDTPMAVKNNVAPNMMFMLDNSGSMNNIVPGLPYVKTATYTCPAGSTVLAGFTTKELAAASSVAAVNTIGSFNSKTGVPRFTYNSNTNRHATIEPTATSGTKVCFNNNHIYNAKLLADNGGNPAIPTGYLDAMYTGHFLNWYFGAYDGPGTGWTDRKKLTSTTNPVQSRMEMAKVAAKAVIAALPIVPDSATKASVRVGLSTYNGADGGRLSVAVDDLKTAKVTTLNSGIDALSPSGSTPLSETLADIGRYFATGYSGNVSAVNVSNVTIDNFLKQGRNSCLAGANCTSTTAAKPIQYWCQRSYVYLMTDGRPQSDQAISSNDYLKDYDRDCSGANASSCSGGYDKKINRSYEDQGSDYLDDIAKALYDVDLRPDLLPAGGAAAKVGKPNNVITYPIGFADLQVEGDPLLQSTADQGGGLFLYASDGAELVTAFKSAITDAFGKDAAAAAVAVANAQITVNNTGYASSYNSGSWYGDLEAYSADTTTGLQAGARIWSAQALLDATTFSTRKIVSYNGTAGVAFNTTNFPTSTNFPTGVVDFLRGDRSNEKSQSATGTFRDRLHVLGDIINAEPVVASYSSGARQIVYQGANDGMLHAFDGAISGATAGQELWAYVPRLVHGTLRNLADVNYNGSHKYFVDGTPAAGDVTGFGAMTKILVGSLGKGGRGYYALDITNPDAADMASAISKFKWEISPANMGYSFGTPLIVNTAAGWKVLVTSGYDNGTAAGGDGKGYLWVVNPGTGAIEKTFTTNVGSAAAPSGLAHIAKLSTAGTDAVIRYVYGGDNLGNVWRFDIDAATGATANLLASLVDASNVAQPVTSAPVIGQVGSDVNKFFVYVGTGRYLADADVSSSQQQTMYGLIDDVTLTTPQITNLRGSNGASCPADGGNGNLICQSLSYLSATNTYRASTTAMPVSKRGWYVDIPLDTRLTKGRIYTRPELTRGGTLVYTVNVPTDAACDPGGSSWVFQLDAVNGGAVPVIEGGTTYYDSGSFLGNALGSRVVVVEGAGGRRGLFRMSDKSTVSIEIKERQSVAVNFKRVYWRVLK